MIGLWVNVVVIALVYLFICIPLLFVFTHRIFSHSAVFGLLFICFLGLLPPVIIFYNIVFLRRRNWAGSHIQQPPVAPPPPVPQSPAASIVVPEAGTQATAQPSSPAPTAPEPKVELAIPGIIKAGVTSYSSFGGAVTTPEVQHPENALLVTDQALCFIYVPMPGADNQLMNTQYVTSVFNKKGIEEKLNQMLATQPVSQIINLDTRNWIVPYAQISSVGLSGFQKTIKIETIGGDKRSYGIKREYWDQLKQLLATKGYGG
jgi:hypothetical protein